jgi:uncharacterized protein (TIGR02646 family)
MRNIVKGVEPKSLAEHRCTEFADYENNYKGEDKQELREHLVAEQRGLCCYCLSRIRPETTRMRIEHWQSQSAFPERQLDYANLLGACIGGEGGPPELHHCDKKRQDSPLSKNPADTAHDVELATHYDKDGTIRSTDPQFDFELNQILNLNLPLLKNNRKAVLNQFLEVGPKHGDWNKALLEKKLAEWNGETSTGWLEPYCQVIVYWLRKRLRRA